MSGKINLSTHGAELKRAYQSVLDANSPNTYCILGYDKGTNDLKVVEEGDGDLDDFVEQFDDGLLLFGFLRIKDPNTNLPKFIFVSWCGEGVPMFKKGSFPSHMGDVMAFMKAYHIHIDARDESDINPQQIMKRVNESSGAKYSYHEQAKQQTSQPPTPSKPKAPPVLPSKPTVSVRSVAANTSVNTGISTSSLPVKSAPLTRVDTPIPPMIPSPVDDRITPVRSVYQKVSLPRPKPLQNRFLEQAAQADRERQEEAARERERRDREFQNQVNLQQKQDKMRQQEEISKIEREESNQQQSVDHQAQRVALARAQEEATEAAREQQRQKEIEEQRLQAEQQKRAEYEKQQREAEEAEEAAEQERLQQEQADYERRQREAEEAAEYERQQRDAEEAAEQERLQQEQAEYERQQREAAEAAEYERQQREAEEQERLHQEQEQRAAEQERVRQEEAQRAAEEEEQRLLAQQTDAARELTYQEQSDPAATQADGDYLTAIALYDYHADDTNELTLKEGEMVTKIQQIEEGWWHGVNESNESGIFPSNYVEIVDNLPADVPVQPQPNGYQEHDQQEELPIAIALYDYVAGDETELNFSMDQYIYDVEFISDDWWQGALETGEKGIFPANYVKLADQ